LNDKLLKGIEYSFYLMLLLYLVGKSFEILTILIDVLFVIYSIKNRNLFLEFYKKFKEIFIAFGVLILYFLIQSLFSNDISIALKHSFGVSRFVILLFAIMYVFNTKEKIRNVMIVSFIALFIVNADSLYQFIFKVDIFGMPMYSGDKRLTAWTDMPIVNLYSGQFFGLLLASIFILKDNYRKIAIFSFVFFIVIFFLSGNRSPIVAMFSTLFIIGLLSSYRKYFIMLFIVLGIVFSLSLFNEKLYKGYSAVLDPTSNKATSGRHQIYRTAFEIIKANPFLGIGGGMFRYEFQDYYAKIYDANSQDKYEKEYLEISPYHSHNILLDMLVSWGIIGLLLIIYVAYFIYKVFVKNRPISLIASIGVLYCITPLQFAKSLSQSNWQFYTFLGLIFLVLVSIYETKEIEEKSSNSLEV
jgi:O-antigen ligase